MLASDTSNRAANPAICCGAVDPNDASGFQALILRLRIPRLLLQLDREHLLCPNHDRIGVDVDVGVGVGVGVVVDAGVDVAVDAGVVDAVVDVEAHAACNVQMQLTPYAEADIRSRDTWAAELS